MSDQITQQQINQTAWAACDTFRGAVDAGQYKDYILVMLFLKYISDLWNDHLETYRKQYGDDEARIRRPPRARAFSSCPRAPASTTSTPSGTRPISAS